MKKLIIIDYYKSRDLQCGSQNFYRYKQENGASGAFHESLLNDYENFIDWKASTLNLLKKKINNGD